MRTWLSPSIFAPSSISLSPSPTIGVWNAPNLSWKQLNTTKSPAIVLCAVVALVISHTIEANPLENPRRMVGGNTVDLSPLFRWWSKHDGERPLNAWVHVTGSVIGTNAWGW